MIAFWLSAALMTAVALAFVLVPLLRARAPAGPSAREANLEVLRSQRRELEADLAVGAMPADAKDEALRELVGRAAEDLDAPDRAVEAPTRRPWPAAVAALVAVPAIAFGTYLAVGNPAAVDAPKTAQAPMDDKQIVAMVENLARKVRERPDDAQGWMLLARSMAALGRFPEASEAYEHLAKLAPGDANVLADWADALGMAQGRKLTGRPAALVRQALEIEPTHAKALALAGTAALESGDFAAATAHWRTLAAQLPADSPDAERVQSILAEVRTRAAAAGKPLADAPPARTAARAPAAGKAVSGSVTLAPALAGKATGDETLFIFARAENGPRVPLAVMRGTARQVPLKFTLDDSQAMAPGMNISSAQAVRIEARISRSGNATPQPGDLVGASAVVKPGARDVAIVIDKVLP